VQATSTLTLEYNNMNKGVNLVLRLFGAVSELVMLAMTSGLRSIRRRGINPLEGNIWRIGMRVISQRRKQINRMAPMQEQE